MRHIIFLLAWGCVSTLVPPHSLFSQVRDAAESSEPPPQAAEPTPLSEAFAAGFPFEWGPKQEPAVYSAMSSAEPRPVPPTEVTLRLVPAAADSKDYPSLRADGDEAASGNAILVYLRAIKILKELRNRNKEYDQLESDGLKNEVPLGSFPAGRAAPLLAKMQPVYDELQVALPMWQSSYEFGLSSPRRTNPYDVEIDEMSDFRSLARYLALKGRLEMKQGEVDAALDTLANQFHLVWAVGEVLDLIVNSLVAVAIEGIALESIDELLVNNQPPNLYWSLATLELNEERLFASYRAETDLWPATFPSLWNTPDYPLDVQPAQQRYREALSEWAYVATFLSGPSREETREKMIQSLLTEIRIDAEYLQAARGRLVDRLPTIQLERMPDEQVVLLDARESLRRLMRRCRAQGSLPLRIVAAQGEEYAKSLTDPADPFYTQFAKTLVPASQQFAAGILRVQQHRHRLITLEALRNYAAEHGKWPANLQELALETPAWDDPGTGGPFGYERKSDTQAVLSQVPMGSRKLNRFVLELVSPER